MAEGAGSRLLAWLERPIGLFILASVVVPVIGLAFSERNVCRTDASDLPYRLSSLVHEFNYRDRSFSTLLANIGNGDNKTDQIVTKLTALARGDDFLSGDFKGRTMVDIVQDIARRWAQMNLSADVAARVWKSYRNDQPAPDKPNIFEVSSENYQVDEIPGFVGRYAATSVKDRTSASESQSIRRSLTVQIVDSVSYRPSCGLLSSFAKSVWGSDSDVIAVAYLN